MSSMPVCRAGTAPHTMLLTGPNMGGKSTLLRAACCAVILAQTGCPVPAESAVISITDRIFTRLGILLHSLKSFMPAGIQCSALCCIREEGAAVLSCTRGPIEVCLLEFCIPGTQNCLV